MNWPQHAYDSASDQELLDKYRSSRNNEWLGILLERYLHLIFGVCMKYLGNEEEAKDHTQQICLHILKNIAHHKITYFKSWLYQVAKNHCLMQLRKNKNIHFRPLSEGDAGSVDPELPEPKTADDVLKLDYLHRAMQKLGEAQRECLNLFFFQKKSYQDISGMTGFSMKQVKSHIQNGKRNLKQIMERIYREQEQDSRSEDDRKKKS